MLIALAIVAVVSAIILLTIGGGSSDSKKPEVKTEEKKKEEKKSGKKKSGGKTYSTGSHSGGRKSSSSSVKITNISIDKLEKHIDTNNCWVTIDGDVYDISNFIQENPNYRKSADDYCGTIAFEAGFLSENNIKDEVISSSVKVGRLG